MAEAQPKLKGLSSDSIEGTGHFRVPIEDGIEIFKRMRGRTSGFAIPQYVLDTPHGKVPLDHPFARGREGDDFVVESSIGHIRDIPSRASEVPESKRAAWKATRFV